MDAAGAELYDLNKLLLFCDLIPSKEKEKPQKS